MHSLKAGLATVVVVVGGVLSLGNTEDIGAPFRLASQAFKPQKPAAVIANPLLDPDNRISDAFSVPKGLEQRVQFWLDVYSKHDNQKHIIHHSRYPWIVFKIVDTAPMIAEGKGPLWLRTERAEKKVKIERIRIQKALSTLAKKNPSHYTSEEVIWIEMLQTVRGNKKLKHVTKLASASLRTQIGQKNFFAGALKNSTQYLEHMESEFSKRGVPTELTRIPFVESSFNEKAMSRVGASGIWQIMPATGKAYMTVNENIDERNSPLKATQIAAKLLKQYYKGTGSWPLAVTSYNHGIGNIKKAIAGAQSRDLVEIIDRYHQGHFKFASSNFYACVLAAIHAEKYSDLLFPDIERKAPINFEVVTLAKPIKAHRLQQHFGISTAEILAMNLDLKSAVKKKASLHKGYKILIPREANKVAVLTAQPKEDRPF